MKLAGYKKKQKKYYAPAWHLLRAWFFFSFKKDNYNRLCAQTVSTTTAWRAWKSQQNHHHHHHLFQSKYKCQYNYYSYFYSFLAFQTKKKAKSGHFLLNWCWFFWRHNMSSTFPCETGTRSNITILLTMIMGEPSDMIPLFFPLCQINCTNAAQHAYT